MALNPHRFVLLQMLFFWGMSVVPAVEINVASHWKNFKKEFEKSYETQSENDRRYCIFQDRVRYIANHNLEADLGLHSYWLGLNHFSDLSDEEFKAAYSCLLIENNTSASEFDPSSVTVEGIDIDYRREGMVTEVKNQGQCGSCYSFVTTATVEALWKKTKGKLVSMSEQEVVDCSTNKGCNGGNFEASYDAVMKMGGLDTEKSYPYEAKKGQCRFKKDSVVGKISGYKKVPRGEEALLKALSSQGPIACGLNAMVKSFYNYNSGIYDDPECVGGRLNHALTVIGYGTENGKPYWLLKNEWSPNWGEQGFMKMVAGKEMCGLSTYCLFPLP